MAREGRQVQLEKSNLRLARNMLKMGKGWFLPAGMEETQCLINRACAKVRQEKK